MRRRHGLCLPLVLTLVSCSSPTEQAGDDLRDRQDQWEALGLDDYAYDFRRICFCGGPFGSVRMTVRNGAVVSVTDVATGQRPQNLPPGWATTVDQIFDELIRDAATAASVVSVTSNAQPS